ncbi:MAG TPA: S53 family peptidase [Candidatus Dormibacteraeota bacterium]
MTSRPRVALLGAGVLIAAASAAHTAATSPPRTATAPVPAVTRHVTREALTFPPDTAWCRTNLERACYRPAQIQHAYGVDTLVAKGLDGRGRTIAVVDSFGSPTIEADLHHFDATFGLPDPPALTIIHPAGAPPAFDPKDPDMVGWAEETTLDVEWAHVMAPGARLLLVETPVSETEGITGFPEIVRAENHVVEHHLADIIAMSFGATEETFPSAAALLGLRSAFENAAEHDVTVLGASGDNGATDQHLDQSCCYPTRVNSWPSSDPLVTSVGGTRLDLDAAGNRRSPDIAWTDVDGDGATGGGVSSIFERPDFQDRVRAVVGAWRGTPDISMNAAIDGAVVFYYSFANPQASKGGWHLVGGTSEATPLFAGIVAIADQVAGHRLGLLNDRLYELAREKRSGIVDVVGGNNSLTFCQAACGGAAPVMLTVKGFNAVAGYNLATGLGTVDAPTLVRRLAGDD